MNRFYPIYRFILIYHILWIKVDVWMGGWTSINHTCTSYIGLNYQGFHGFWPLAIFSIGVFKGWEIRKSHGEDASVQTGSWDINSGLVLHFEVAAVTEAILWKTWRTIWLGFLDSLMDPKVPIGWSLIPLMEWTVSQKKHQDQKAHYLDLWQFFSQGWSGSFFCRNWWSCSDSDGTGIIIWTWHFLLTFGELRYFCLGPISEPFIWHMFCCFSWLSNFRSPKNSEIWNLLKLLPSEIAGVCSAARAARWSAIATSLGCRNLPPARQGGAVLCDMAGMARCFNEETTKSTFVLEVEDTAEENGSPIFRSMSQEFNTFSYIFTSSDENSQDPGGNRLDLEVRTAIWPLAHDAESGCWAELLRCVVIFQIFQVAERPMNWSIGGHDDWRNEMHPRGSPLFCWLQTRNLTFV